jgi:GWxTD domain-containing protein
MDHYPQEKNLHILLLLTLIITTVFSDCVFGFDEKFKGETRLIKNLKPEERVEYFGLRYLMNKYQIRQFLNLESKEARDRWIETFWLQHDPTPTTKKNEKMIEHNRRVSMARRLYKKKTAPGWDKRGETLIRFGVPSQRTRTWGNVGMYRMTPPGEVWYYISLDMIVSFQNFNLDGEFIYSIEPIGRTARQEQDILKGVSNFFNYENVELLYPVEYMTTDEIKDFVEYNPDEIDYMADPDIRLDQPRDMIAEMEKEKRTEKVNNFFRVMKENPVIHSYQLEHRVLPLFFDVTSFQAGQDKYRTEVNFEVPSSEVNFVRRQGHLMANVNFRVSVIDKGFKQIALEGDIVKAYQADQDTFRGPSHLPGQVVLTLDPGYYRLGIEAIDMHSGRRGTFRSNLELDKISESLSLSDIQFASSIRKTQENKKFVKGNLQVVPHPLRAYRIPYPITIYFEIYGLDTDENDISFYQISYRIIPVSKKRKGPIIEDVESTIKSSFKTSGYGSRQVQRLQIATENLWQGTFEFQIEVTDRRTLQIAEKRAKFSILE